MSKLKDKSSSEAFQLSTPLRAGLAFLILLEIIAPFVFNSYGPDGGFHLYWIEQFTKLNSGGIFFPRWIPESFSGFGSASFYFYPPLTYYLASIVKITTGVTSPAALFQIVSLIGTIGSFFTSRSLLRSLGAEGSQVIIGAALFAFAPYRIAEIYSLSSLSTHIAYIFLPLVWGGLIRIVTSDHSNRKGMLLFAASFALMTLSNIPLTVLTLVTMIVAAVVFRHTINSKAWAGIVMGFAIAGLLVFFYLISIVTYAPYVQLDYLSKQREFFLDDILHFRNLPGLYHLVLLYMAIVAIIIGYVQIRLKKEQITRQERAMLRIGMALTAMLLLLEIPPIGRPILNSVPVIELIQGTWRFYIDIVLLVSCIVGIARSTTLRRIAKQIIGVWILGAILPLFLILMHIHLAEHQKTKISDPPEYAPIYTLHNHDSLDVILSHLIDRSPIVAEPRGGEDNIKIITLAPGNEEYDVDFKSRSAVTFHRFYWPAWHIYAQGSEVISHPDSIGRAVAMLLTGHYTARWQLEKTPIELAGLWISGIAWGGLLTFSGIGLVRRSVRRKLPAPKD